MITPVMLKALRLSYRFFPDRDAKITITPPTRRWCDGHASTAWAREWLGIVH